MARLATAVLLIMVALSLKFDMAKATTVFVRNQCPFTVCAKFWVPKNGVGGGCSQLGPGGTWAVGVSSRWEAGVIWAITNTGCGGQACNTGPPGGVTLFEITAAAGDGNDYYDISAISGYNIPMRVTTTNTGCPSAYCRGQDGGSCPTGYYPGGPDATKGCRAGTTDYNVYLCASAGFSQDGNYITTTA